MATLRASVQVLPPVHDQPSNRVGQLHELCAYLYNEPAAEQFHAGAVGSNSEGPPRKRQRLSEPSHDPAYAQGIVVLASIHVRLVRSSPSNLQTHVAYDD
jgi:hypothetical protein